MRKVLFVVMFGIAAITSHSQAFALDCDMIKSLGEKDATHAIWHFKEGENRLQASDFEAYADHSKTVILFRKEALEWATIYNAFCKD